MSLHSNCDLDLVPSLSISFCSAAETEINSGPLSHRILDDCLSWTRHLTHTGVICLPSLSKNTALVRSNKRPKITDFFFLPFYVFFFVRNYMVQVLNLEQGRSPPVKWVCHRWRRRVCNCVNEPPSPFRGRDLHPSLFRDAAHAVSCSLLFFFPPFISTVNLFTFAFSCTSLIQHFFFCLCPSISVFMKIISSLSSGCGHNPIFSFFFFFYIFFYICRY